MPTLSLAHSRPALLFGILALLLVAVEWQITRLPQFYQRSALPAAVSVDLLLGLPLLFYFVVARRYRLSPLMLVVAFGAAVAVGSWVLPAGQQQYVRWGKTTLLLAEPLILLGGLWHLRRLVRAYRHGRQQGETDFLTNLESSLQAVVGRPLRPLLGELAVLRYALWFGRPAVAERAAAPFTAYRQSAFRATMGALLLASGVEMLVAHLLLVRWSAAAAGVALALSLYSVLFVLGHLRAVMLRPIVVTDGRLRLRVGFVWQVDMPLNEVADAYLLPAAARLRPDTLNLARLLLTEPNVLLALRAPVPVRGLYGLTRWRQRLALYVDDPQAFIEAVKS